jgi:hypothetical protein
VIVYFGERFCLAAVLAVAESRGFSIGLSVRTAFLREAVTAGTNAHTTYGENISQDLCAVFCVEVQE